MSGISKEARQIASEYVPTNNLVRDEIENWVFLSRMEAARQQNAFLRSIELVSFKEALGDFDWLVNNESIESKLEKMRRLGDEEAYSISLGDVTGTGTLFLSVDKEVEDGKKVFEKFILYNERGAVDLISLFTQAGLQQIVFDPKENIISEDETKKIVIVGEYDKSNKSIFMYADIDPFVLGHEVGHSFQRLGPEMTVAETIRALGNFWGRELPYFLRSLVTLSDKTRERLKSQHIRPVIYERLLETNTEERNADAFAIALTRRFRELGLPIVNDSLLREWIAKGKTARANHPSYTSNVVRRVNNRY